MHEPNDIVAIADRYGSTMLFTALPCRCRRRLRTFLPAPCLRRWCGRDLVHKRDVRATLSISAVQSVCVLDLVQEISVTPTGSGTVGLQEGRLIPFEPGSLEKERKKEKAMRHCVPPEGAESMMEDLLV